MACYAPSDFLDQQDLSPVGTLAEAFIEQDYLRYVGRTLVFPSSKKEFFDSRGGFHPVYTYWAFLKENNKHLSLSELAAVRGQGQRRVPDIVTHDAAKGRFEYYEIKPGSVTGLRDGLDKLAGIDALNDRFGLPYRPGTSYKPRNEIEIFSGRSLGIKLRLLLQVRCRTRLILYKVCVEAPDWLSEAVVVAAMAAALVAMVGVTRGRGLRFIPRLVLGAI